MATGVFLALSNPVSGDVDAEFNDWYDRVHTQEVLRVPGVRSCRRFRLAPVQVMPGDDATTRQYLASTRSTSTTGRRSRPSSRPGSVTGASRSDPT